MLGLSVLTAGTLAAGATGTLAWFTTNKTAKATYTNIKAQGTQGNLEISIGAVTAGTKNASNNGGTAISDGGALTSDVSSTNGIDFYQPDWTSTSGNADNTQFNSIQTVTGKAGYYTQYTITIHVPANTANIDKLDISLVGVEISGGTNFKNWTRVAINSAASNENNFLKPGDGNQVYLFQNTVTDSNKKYVNKDKKADATTMGEVLDVCDPTPVEAKATLTSKITANKWRAIPQDGSITLGVSVWLEGTMSGNQDQEIAKSETVDVSLTFAAAITE